jgi:hypothetical protein
MRKSRARRGLVAVAAAALTVIGTVTGCGTSGGDAPVTLTKTVTVEGGSDAVQVTGTQAGTGSTTETSGAPITVVGPDTAGSGTSSSEGGADAPTTTGSPGTSDAKSAAPTTSSTAPTTVGPEARAATRMLAAQCTTVLGAGDIAAALGKSLDPAMIRVEDVANPDNKMTGRAKCYFGTSDIGAARPLVVAIAAFADADAAAQQLNVTLQSEQAAGAKTSKTDVKPGDGRIKVMLRDGGLAVTQAGAATVSIAIDKSVISDSALRSALTLLTRSVLKHVE